MKKALIILVVLLICIIVLIWIPFPRKPVEKRPPILLKNASGIDTTEFQLHESILFDAVDLSPRTGYDIRIERDDGEIVTELRLSSDELGRIPETVIWYNIGVRPCPEYTEDMPVATFVIEHDVSDFEYAGRSYHLKIMKEGNLVRDMTFQIAEVLVRPVLYASDARGCAKSGFLIGEEDVWVVGKNFPKGSIIRLWAVLASSVWAEENPLRDQTKQYGYKRPPIFELNTEETNFRKLLWPRESTSTGSYDIVAEVVTYEFGAYRPIASAEVQNVVSNLTYSGFVVQRRPGVAEPLEVDIAGSLLSPYTFRDSFLTTENVYVGVDPCFQPSYVGQTARIYIVENKTDAQWTTDPNLVDVTGIVENITVGGICGNCWKTLAWAKPLVPGKYDVVLDFDQNDKYTPGVDLIDSLDTAGFTVAEVRVNAVSFNYSGSGAITLFDHVNGINVNPPEYYAANLIVKPAAWVMGGAHAVQVEFKAVPSINSADIWAEDGLGGLNSSGSPVTVSFSGGTGQEIFNVNSPPTSIGKYPFYWDWKYKNVNGSNSLPVDMGKTGEHILYIVYATPGAPMLTPWLEVIDRSCQWAQGESDMVAACTAVTARVNAIADQDGDVDYTPGTIYSSNGSSAWQFDLTDFLHDLNTASSMQFNCADCANALQVFQNALGLGLQYRILDMGGSTNYIDPIGNGNPANSTDPVENWLTTSWGWHCVGWLSGNLVYDACLHLDGEGSPATTPCSRLAPANMNYTTYCNYLTPASTPCSPDEQNVCTVY